MKQKILGVSAFVLAQSVTTTSSLPVPGINDANNLASALVRTSSCGLRIKPKIVF